MKYIRKEKKNPNGNGGRFDNGAVRINKQYDNL